MKSPNYRSSIITVLIVLTILSFAAAINMQADVIVCFPMNTNPGWNTQGQCQFSMPLGQGRKETFMEKNLFRLALIKRQLKGTQLL